MLLVLNNEPLSTTFPSRDAESKLQMNSGACSPTLSPVSKSSCEHLSGSQLIFNCS